MAKGRAKLAVSPGLSVWVLETEDFDDPDVHAHHAIQITACLDGRLTLFDRDGAVSGELLAVAPGAPHSLAAKGTLAVVFVEPESTMGRSLLGLFDGHRIMTLENPELALGLSPLRDAIPRRMSSDEMLAIGRSALAAVATTGQMAPDPRIQRIIEYVSTGSATSLAAAAQGAGVFMSESRLRHLFVEQTGLAFKTYMAWQRLVRAVGLYAEGCTLTQAAHEAGFSDSAHFSRAFKATFGAPASTLERV